MLLWMLMACGDDPPCEDCPDTSAGIDSDIDYVECPDFYTGPVTLERAAIACRGTDTVRFELDTAGWTTGGTVFSQETANPDDPFEQWSDEHPVPSVDFHLCGAWDHLEVDLQTGATLATWEPGVSTLFQCNPDVHFDSNRMTYAARVYDFGGVFADCLVWGHDVQGMLDGTWQRANEPSAPEELAACVEGVPTR